MKMLLPLALVAGLSSCATMPTAPETSARLLAAIDRADLAYQRAKPFAELLLPYLPDARAGQVRTAMATIERSLVAARLATTIAQQLALLAQAEAAMATIAEVAGPTAN